MGAVHFDRAHADAELLGLLRSELDLAGPFWTFVERVNGQSSAIGYAIVAVFLASWLLSLMLYKSRRRVPSRGQTLMPLS